MRKALVDELHHRFSSAESLNRVGRGTWHYSAPASRHRLRAASISGLTRGDPEWKSTSIEELRARKSSKSIEVCIWTLLGNKLRLPALLLKHARLEGICEKCFNQ